MDNAGNFRRRLMLRQGHSRSTLDRMNETFAAHGRTLHPTKGFREISEKRSRAASLVLAMRSGLKGFPLTYLRETLRVQS